MHWQTFLFIRMQTNAYVIKTFLCFIGTLFTLTFLPSKNIYLIIKNEYKSMVFTMLRGCLPYSNARMVRMVLTMIHLYIFHFCFLLHNSVRGLCACPWILVVYNPCLDSVCCAFGEKKSKEEKHQYTMLFFGERKTEKWGCSWWQKSVLFFKSV